jgi:hypothetical protein
MKLSSGPYNLAKYLQLGATNESPGMAQSVIKPILSDPERERVESNCD